MPKEVAAKSESDDHEGESSDDDEKQTSKKRKTDDGDSDEEMDNTTTATKQPKTDQPKAKAVSTMYADVFSSMQHAVGHTQKKAAVDGTNNSSDKDTKNNTDAINTDNTTNANDDNREVSTGTSHDKSIRSYSAIPDGPNIKTTTNKEEEGDEDSTLSTRPPAKTYPFTLDPFQQTAINYVEKNESVLVAAHTSAGKTVHR